MLYLRDFMLLLPQAAQLSIHFLFRKISSAAPPWGSWLRTYYQEIEREEKALHPAGTEPTTSRVLLHRPVLYRCATTTAPFKNLAGQIKMHQSQNFQNTVSADGLWLLPDNVKAYQTLSCSYDSLTEEIKGKASQALLEHFSIMLYSFYYTWIKPYFWGSLFKAI